MFNSAKITLTKISVDEIKYPFQFLRYSVSSLKIKDQTLDATLHAIVLGRANTYAATLCATY